ncbi:hypothetical protein A2115_00460 [Candidatus Woesebacteria bacterium GWA1_41_8]|uniref:Uncharacterized protein n=1 Tax=Candidatus Woesebacteria bacterium GWA1_41_8 TaxID=1802471 RepID=A0A1F7WIL3_9BACT|nr:MAG: hypothetical protein A2115_00460 [Candidatus Woesebacteria bacterium GWA1_41_8]
MGTNQLSDRVVGYILFAAGILIILYSAFNVYKVFTKVFQPVELFNFAPIGLDASSLVGSDLPPEQRELLRQSGGDTKLEIVPSAIINQTSNVLAHLLLMGFLASVGYKIANLGIMMLRPVVVKLIGKEAPKLPE